MREQVKAYLASKGVTDPRVGWRFRGVPETAAFAGVGEMPAPTPTAGPRNLSFPRN